jgi:ferredoxin
MSFVRTSFAYLLIALAFVAPLVPEQETCVGEQSVTIAAAHADHGSSGASHDGDSAEQGCLCCDQCPSVCTVSGFAAGASSALEHHPDYFAGSQSSRPRMADLKNLSLLPLFRPPISFV